MKRNRYIDADALAHLVASNGDADFINKVTKLMIDAPSIDIEPKRGEWIRDASSQIAYRCTVCNTLQHWPVIQDGKYNFCPNCGADMREREGE